MSIERIGPEDSDMQTEAAAELSVGASARAIALAPPE
jgi:hypothetical protein